jgi:hypothetical protein
MKQLPFRLLLAMLLIAALSGLGYAQGGSSSLLTGTVVDQSGGVIPGADVSVKNEATGAEYKAVSAENGQFTIPALAAGNYTVTVSVPNFKQSVIKNVSVVVGSPTNLKITMVVGGTTETVTVQAGAEIIQTASATVSTTLQTAQIQNLPLSTRNAIEFLAFLPGVNTTAGVRQSTIMGLPQAAINITIDGVNTQDNFNKTTDGFFSYISPRIDAMQEVTMSSATPGAESAGQGAVQVKFITRSGSSDFHGSAYYYVRNPALNSNYWFSNRDGAPAFKGPGDGIGQNCTAAQMATSFEACKAKRDRILLHQPGGRIGGPILIPWLLKSRERAFFFINIEELRMPEQVTRTRYLYDPSVEQGNYLYVYKQTGQPDVVRSVNLLTLAAANGQTSTLDPTVAKLFADMRAATTSTGALKSYPQYSDPLYQQYIVQFKGIQIRKFPTGRIDINLTSKHRFESSWNMSQYTSQPDFLNSAEPAFPGFPNQGFQNSNRWATSAALRSTLTARLVNEFRFGANGGTVLFFPNASPGDYTGSVANSAGYAFAFLGTTSNYFVTNGPSRRNSPVETFDDTVTWTKGSHGLSFGYNWTNIGSWIWSKTLVPPITLGTSSYDPAYAMFNDSTAYAKNFPNATSSQASTAGSTYADLTARVVAVGGSAVLNEKTLQYTYIGDNVRRAHVREMGTFATDSWRVRPGLTVNYGLRWELQLPWVPLNDVFSFASPEQVWGLSGVNSIFKPGATGGVASVLTQMKAGTKGFNTDYKMFAPSLGFAWTPKGKGFLEKILGSGSQTVLRGGISVSYNRYGMGTYDSMYGSNPGGTVSASRSVSLGNFPVPGYSWPVLFRDAIKTGSTALSPADFSKTPVYPLVPTTSDTIRTFDPNLRTPYTISWTFGLQRELTKNTVLEVRYAGNRNKQTWYAPNLNSINIIENKWIDEFKLAQANLTANRAAGRGNTFRYFGPNTNTVPLPIMIAYTGGKLDPTDASNYTSAKLGSVNYALFQNSTYINTYLNPLRPDPATMASNLYGDLTRRNNALAYGLPANFFYVNPAVSSAYIYRNGGGSIYDSMVVELRRRMAKGLLVQGNYVWSKGFNMGYYGFRAPWVKELGDALPHALKASWIYELPFGQGRALFSGSSRVMDRIIGGWEFQGTMRVQAGNLLDFGNVVLVGMTGKELADSVGMRFDDAKKIAYYVPQDIIDQTYKSYTSDITGYTSGAPSGRYVARPGTANGGNCIQITSLDCAPLHNYVRGPMFARYDLSLVKKIRFTEQANFELRGEFLNAFNNINFYGSTCASSSLTCGQATTAYTDRNTTHDPGGRLIQIVMRINF